MLISAPRSQTCAHVRHTLPNKHTQVDVVLINDAADPPVVRLVDFSKYKYDLEKTAKAKQKASKG
jgi:translation initiation factor IF-3